MANPPGVYVTNLREVRAYLRKLHPDLLPVLRNELKTAVTTTVVPSAKSRVPTRSGAAAGSIRATSGGNTVYLVAGNAKAPYYGWLDFGGTLRPVGRRRNTQYRPKVTQGRYLYPAIAEASRPLVEAAGRAVDRITRT